MKVGSILLGCTLVLAFASAGCHQDMYEQKRYNPLSTNDFFRDGRSSRPRVEGTVVHGDHSTDGVISTGKVDGKPVNVFPFPVTEKTLLRGQERFNIFCSPCHGRTGDGQGMIVQRGFPQPPSYFSDSVRAKPVGHYVDVIANGFGRMYSYRDRVEPLDRWAIAAYIRVLQASRTVNVSELTTSERQRLK
ncbi:MAG: cytochrome c [Bacteroidota bacterium]